MQSERVKSNKKKHPCHRKQTFSSFYYGEMRERKNRTTTTTTTLNYT